MEDAGEMAVSSREPGVAGMIRLAGRGALAASASAGLFSALQIDKRLRPLEGAEADARLERYVQRWARALLAALAVRPVIVGDAAAAGQGRVVVSNHRSTLDILLMLDLFGGCLLARGDMAGWPVMGRLAREAGTLFVDREDPSSGAGAIQRVRERLKRKLSVSIFPEGTTFPGDEVRPFHAGAFVAAAREKVPVLPVGIAYASEDAIYGDEPIGEHLRRIVLTPRTRVAVAIGVPFATRGLGVQALADRARGEVQALVHQARAAI
jgi:1-acyl-sn-glycerol-3-phosphate acyltransferase